MAHTTETPAPEIAPLYAGCETEEEIEERRVHINILTAHRLGILPVPKDDR